MSEELPFLEQLNVFADMGDHASSGKIELRMLNGDIFREAYDHIDSLRQTITMAADMLEMGFPKTAMMILLDTMFDSDFGWRNRDRDD